MAPRGDDIPLRELVRVARRRRDDLLESMPAAPRFVSSEANAVARMDAVIGWLEQVPVQEWTNEYLEYPL